MAKSFGQFDQGAGQRYARSGSSGSSKKKRKVNPNPDPPKPTSSGRRRMSESQVMADMKRHRRSVLRGGN